MGKQLNTVFSCSTLAITGSAALLWFIPAPALATPQVRDAFRARYPSSTLLTRTAAAYGDECYMCHQPTNTSRTGNCYRMALRARINAGRTRDQALADVELLDSDGDGVNNITEILMVRTDGVAGVGYNPGLVGATGTDPCATAGLTTVAITHQLETPPPPPVTCAADIGVQGGQPGHDALLDNNDFVIFIDYYFNGDSRADFGRQGGAIGADGLFDNNDFVVFIDLYFTGC